MKYCKHCERMVQPMKSFNWGAFLLLCLTGIGGIFYLIWWLIKGKQCPICGGRL